MGLIPLTRSSEIKVAFKQSLAHITYNARKFRRTVGYQGGNDPVTLYWHAAEQLWVFSEPGDNRHWFGFGTADPNQYYTLGIVCEVNVPYAGMNRRAAGVFARDEQGVVYPHTAAKSVEVVKVLANLLLWRLIAGATGKL